jgi:hypothetical protein
MDLSTLWQNLVAAFWAWFTAWSASNPDLVALLQKCFPGLAAKISA